MEHTDQVFSQQTGGSESGSKTPDHTAGIFVLGLCALLAPLIIPAVGSIVGLICGIVGITLAGRLRQSGRLTGLAQAGFILSIIGTAVGGVVVLLGLVVTAIGLSFVSGLAGLAGAVPWFLL